MMDEQSYRLSYDRQPEEFSGCLKNRYRYEEDSLAEAMRAYSLSGFSLVLHGALLLFYLLLIGYLIWLYALGVRSSTLFWEFCLMTLAIAAMLLSRFVIAPRQSARLQLRRQQELFGQGTMEPLTIFTEAEILGENKPLSNDLGHLQYSSLKRVRVTKRLILLITATRQFLILDRARFENGTEADLWKLLHEKRPDLKLPN